jgi:hypothetical protein
MAEKAKADEGGPFKEFVFEEWLRDGLEGIRHEMKQKRVEFNVENFRKHLRNAQKEQLLAVRSLLDSTIECLEKAEEKAKQDKA